jgi:hypothetical protein
VFDGLLGRPKGAGVSCVATLDAREEHAGSRERLRHALVQTLAELPTLVVVALRKPSSHLALPLLVLGELSDALGSPPHRGAPEARHDGQQKRSPGAHPQVVAAWDEQLGREGSVVEVEGVQERIDNPEDRNQHCHEQPGEPSRADCFARPS